MAQPAKDGYEAAPLLDRAEAGVQTPDWQAEQPATRTWHGSLFACCGPQCDALGWTTCLITHYFPPVVFGINARKAHGKSALRAGLLFATLILLSWAHYAAQMSLVDSDCLADFMPPPDNRSPRRMGPAFTESNGSMHHWAAKPFGRPMDAVKASGPRCMRLMQTCALLNLATLVYGLALLVYGAMLRTSMRERFGIHGSRCGDLFAWLCCAPCSMCQEARTLAVNNVELGQWNGPTPGLPVVYFAAAETQAPSVPVMSADIIKQTKA
jgi:Cys-rich protein (TIGR01571 family)